jgi:hypothetical protein
MFRGIKYILGVVKKICESFYDTTLKLHPAPSEKFPISFPYLK